MSLGLKFLSCAISVSSLVSPAPQHTGWGDLRAVGKHGEQQAGIALNPTQGIGGGEHSLFPALIPGNRGFPEALPGQKNKQTSSLTLKLSRANAKTTAVLPQSRPPVSEHLRLMQPEPAASTAAAPGRP